ncbi:DUF6349 family protein [Streptomyces sp. NPDC048385]|uniref:DUF6349 family protein n=1 Tax=Streptomyces sp. NPDC048385 TaxID=3155145 RepID=UPI00343F554A
MSNDTGAIARQRHYTSLRNADREVLRAAWSIGYGDPGFTTQFGIPPEPSTRHTATSIGKIVADVRRLQRGACLACSWEGPDRRRRDAAIEDAHDHTHPGWRDLPIFDRARSGKASKLWWAHVRASYPNDWFDVGGPLRLYVEPPFDRHQAGAAPGGGFVLHTARRKRQTSSSTQLSLEEGGPAE